MEYKTKRLITLWTEVDIILKNVLLREYNLLMQEKCLKLPQVTLKQQADRQQSWTANIRSPVKEFMS